MVNELFPARIVEGITEPVFKDQIQLDWFSQTQVPQIHKIEANAKEMAFMVKRNVDQPRQGWTQFNQEHSDVDPPQTTIGYMPLILAPAHEMDTLNTVVKRCKYIANSLGQKYVVLTVDEALYCKLMDLKWAKKEYQEFLSLRLGGLHTAMNFMKAIGQHLKSTGILEVWIDSGLLGRKTAENAMIGKTYEKAVRAHKITSQAMWQILLPQILEYLQQTDSQLRESIDNAICEDDDEELINILSTEKWRDSLISFSGTHAADKNFMFWWDYLMMVNVLLMFLRAQRDGLWELHLVSFCCMLPYFHIYDHTNYAKWGAVYLAEMNQLPEEVHQSFKEGDFVVKVGKAKFNQVDPDQSQEWLNGTGKKGGGIVGITKTTSALHRWALSFNMRAQIRDDTRKLYGITLDDSLSHKEASSSRRQKDSKSEDEVVKVLQRLNVFTGQQTAQLQNISTKDQATENISKALLGAPALGQKLVETFVTERLIGGKVLMTA